MYDITMAKLQHYGDNFITIDFPYKKTSFIDYTNFDIRKGYIHLFHSIIENI